VKERKRLVGSEANSFRLTFYAFTMIKVGNITYFATSPKKSRASAVTPEAGQEHGSTRDGEKIALNVHKAICTSQPQSLASEHKKQVTLHASRRRFYGVWEIRKDRSYSALLDLSVGIVTRERRKERETMSLNH